LSLVLLLNPSPSSAEEGATISREELRRIIREEISNAIPEQKSDREENLPDESLSTIERVVREEIDKQAKAPSPVNESESEESPFELKWGGYGDIRYSYYDYPEDINQPEGSRSDSRGTFDLTRFVLKLEGEYEPAELGFEAEIEFEHGGTGSSLELEFEEFGEFESEVENGGEVILEEFYLKKKFGDWKAKVGRFYVAVGTLSYFYTPLDYLGTARPESEITMLPAVWDEIGFHLERNFDWMKLTFQVVNGLDSSGFSSSRWVSTGHQERFEVNRAEDLAYVLRLDLMPTENVTVGGSAYWAPSTSGNRPRDDLDVDGELLILSAHADYRYGAFMGRSFVSWGNLDDAAEISERNSRLSNNLQVPRTPVADQAIAMWTEVGFDLADFVLESAGTHQLIPFFRFDYYDTMLETSEGVFDNPRFERTAYTAGLAYRYRGMLTAKVDFTHREFDASDVDSQELARLSFGFIY
jgi:hypothetical protein